MVNAAVSGEDVVGKPWEIFEIPVHRDSENRSDDQMLNLSRIGMSEFGV